LMPLYKSLAAAGGGNQKRG